MQRILASIPVGLALVSGALAQQQAPAVTQPLTQVVETRSGASAPLLAAEADGARDIGIEGFTARPCTPVFSREVVAVGPASGEAEKDTYGHTVIGDACR
ncbi:hypothetical protein [Roseicella aerolata]|uniref:Uncharacterized protein n=1 Tax=Roseicella aerolata TaxID=2883479 RepID=A0A9X1LDM8_9PROT|nr:hypothetical protein [Roseicella aerolata]MCB4825037.1 hypothetical protein [Roseicella aerolata]